MDNFINDLVETIIRNAQSQAMISPGWVADKAYLDLDPLSRAPKYVALLARSALRHVARQKLALHFQPDDIADMLPNVDWPKLQQRYPLRPQKDQQPYYIKLELLSEDDMRYNVARLRKEATAKEKHAEQLELWWEEHH